MSALNPNLILTKAITGTFFNRFLSDPNTNLKKIVSELLEKVKLPKSIAGEGGEGEIAMSLRYTYDWLLAVPLSETIRVEDIRSRLIINCAFAEDYAELIRDQLDVDTTNKEAMEERVKSIIAELKHDLNVASIGTMVSDIHRKINFGAEIFDVSGTLEMLKNQVEDIQNQNATMHEGFGGKVDFSNLQSIRETINNAKENLSYDGILKTGLQGLNKLWGVGGYIRGGSYLYGARTHNYKTGILLDHCEWFCTLNSPRLLDKTKKPMILRVSFENKPEQDIPIMYRSIWEAENLRKCDFAEVDIEEAAQYIQERYNRNGFHFEMVCFDPNNMDVWDLINILKGYEAEGYEIHAVVVDYMELITKKGSKHKRLDELIVYSYEVLRNYCFPRNITQIHAHQLNTQTDDILRETGSAGFAKKVASGGYWMNCRSLETKVDGACTMHIHRMEDDAYLTLAWSKNRTSSDTPERAKSVAYKFHEFGGITPDLLDDKSKAIYSFAEVTASVNDTSADDNEEW
ncbi:DNA helicase [Vibrio phage C-ZP2022]|nr:DNA helicase [Vibrio phage C-ZP2022]